MSEDERGSQGSAVARSPAPVNIDGLANFDGSPAEPRSPSEGSSSNVDQASPQPAGSHSPSNSEVEITNTRRSHSRNWWREDNVRQAPIPVSTAVSITVRRRGSRASFCPVVGHFALLNLEKTR